MNDLELLKERLTEYRRAAAVMLADWTTLPSESFREKHKALLHDLINGDLQKVLIPGLNRGDDRPQNGGAGRPRSNKD